MKYDCKGAETAYWRHHVHLLTAAALMPVLAGIYYLSFWLRFDARLGNQEWACFRNTAGWVTLAQIVWFVGLDACRGWRRSVTFYDLAALLRVATCGMVTVAMIQYLFSPLPTIPRGVILLDWSTTIVVLGGARSLLREAREAQWPLFLPAGGVRVLIAGAGEMGAATLRMIRHIDRPRYRVVGFLDDDPELVGTHVEGVPVIGGCRDARRRVQRHGVRQLLVMQGELVRRSRFAN